MPTPRKAPLPTAALCPLLCSVAEAFNTMVEEQEVRQRRLQTALDDNRFLVPDVQALPPKERELFQRYVYW